MDTITASTAASTGKRDGDRTLVRLFKDLWRETSTLVHDEVELVRVEVAEKVDQVGTSIAVIATAAAVLFAGFLILLLAAVNWLALALPEESAPWLAPLIIGAIVMIAGFIALNKGRADLKARNLKPERTLESMRRNRELLREHVK
jgi:hypothetical protein